LIEWTEQSFEVEKASIDIVEEGLRGTAIEFEEGLRGIV